MNLWLSFDELHSLPVVKPLVVILVGDISQLWRNLLSDLSLKPWVSDEEQGGEEEVWQQVDVGIAKPDHVETHFIDVLDFSETFEGVGYHMSAWLVNYFDVIVSDCGEGIGIRAAENFSSGGSESYFRHHSVNPLECDAVVLEAVIFPCDRFGCAVVQRGDSEPTEFPRSRESWGAGSNRTVFSGMLLYKGIGVSELLVVAIFYVVENLDEGVFHRDGSD